MLTGPALEIAGDARDAAVAQAPFLQGFERHVVVSSDSGEAGGIHYHKGDPNDLDEALPVVLRSAHPRLHRHGGAERGHAANISYLSQAHPGREWRTHDEPLGLRQLFDAAGKIQGTIEYGDDEKDVLAKLTALAEPDACHPGPPTQSTLWGKGGSIRCGTSGPW